MGLEMSKRFFSYIFHLMSAKHYQNIIYHGGIQALTFLAIGQVLKKIVAL